MTTAEIETEVKLLRGVIRVLLAILAGRGAITSGDLCVINRIPANARGAAADDWRRVLAELGAER